MKYLSDLAKLALATALLVSTAGCSPAESLGDQIVIGQQASVQRLDPASIYGVDNQEVMFQAFGSLFNAMPGSLELQPDLAESGEFISPKEFKVVVREGLRFSNGNTLDASDVKHSIDRMRIIDDVNGPQVLLQYLDEVQIQDSRTVIFKLENEYDQTFVQVLSSVATVIVDEEVFPLDSLLAPEEIIAAGSFSGPYVIESFEPETFVSFRPNPSFQGIWGEPKNDGVIVRYYADSNNLALDAKTGQLDVVLPWRALTPSATRDAISTGDLTQVVSEGSVPVFLSFRLASQPFGSSLESADEDKARAVRQAFAHLIDREVALEAAYAGSLTTAFSVIPKGLLGHSQVFKDKYGNGAGQPSVERARQTLADAGISQKVTIRLLYPPDRYGPMSEVLVNQIKDQVEKDGLFEIVVSTAEWSAFREIRRAETVDYDMFLSHWGPDFADSDNYLSPLFGPGGWLATGFDDPSVNSLIGRQLSARDASERDLLLKELEAILATELPAIILGMDGRSALVKKDIQGLDEILDVTFKVRYGFISRQ